MYGSSNHIYIEHVSSRVSEAAVAPAKYERITQ